MESEITPADSQTLFKMLERLIRHHRKGGNVYVIVDDIRAEWEKQNLPCAVEKHIKRHNLDRFIKN